MLVDLYRYRKLLIIAAVLMVLTAIITGIRQQSSTEQPSENEVPAATFFGELIPWEEADQLFPKYAKARIVDVDTRLSFRVQRRAGTEHADVQPLTKADTEIMKTIYQGKWSWQRKAIIVELESGPAWQLPCMACPMEQGLFRAITSTDISVCTSWAVPLTVARAPTPLIR